MPRVVERYANSYIEQEATPLLNIQLIISECDFTFKIPGRHGSFEISARYKRRVSDSRPDIVLLLLESLVTIALPQSVTTMHLDFRGGDTFVIHAPPLQAFCSMRSITVLETCPAGLFYLGQVKQPGFPFPLLDTFLLKKNPSGQDGNSLQECIHPFLAHRDRTTPVKVLKLDFAFGEPADLRFLDALAGLKIVGGIYTESGPFEYVCGSGDEQRLCFLADPGSNGQ
ncbi:hypothetical protein HYPSUDRAFT_428650 [Hypholoma sublateritium FD-334 SS-4]|uniref:Uncharacterized protein n=1 Tax=Hypholoma sublateritium (strain FD-334 SS-4) TaxID=945553 RepID=A0A0D2KJ38_HYPSF|nr:hypothetical protein HYPSUDRAFT_428650 [Hypholoma sublateritium FD-334 SS-4]